MNTAQKTNINPAILQQMLESATNAAEKGQSQFFTPIHFGRRLAIGLPRCRPAIVDLNCGNGMLLQAAANTTTRTLFGSDIDPCRIVHPSGEEANLVKELTYRSSKISYDATLLYPLLKDVGLHADLFVLNPPWRLFWHRDRLADLAESDLMAVRDAFNAVEPGIPKGTIDSTIATLLMALDLTSLYGEGLLIANNATLERLLFAPDAPHAAVARHIWGHAIFPGNPMTGRDDCNWLENGGPSGEDFHTGVIYFARSHNSGPQKFLPDQLDEHMRLHRMGVELTLAQRADSRLPDLWSAVKDRVHEIETARPRVPFNLWLTATGRIRTALSLFENLSRKVNKQEAARLQALDGKTPMELVLQRNTRDELMHVAERGGWRVAPELAAAVQAAIHDYHASRAPLYPLPKIQRLGYLDEQDQIACEKTLALPDGRIAFHAGRTYPIRTQTVQVTRSRSKPNAQTGEPEDLEYNGQELAIYIAGEVLPDGHHSPAKPETRNPKPETKETEYCFMDATLREEGTTVSLPDAKGRAGNEKQGIDFTLQELCEHFSIPEVPDVATVNPDGYRHNLDLLSEIEQLVNA